MASRLQVLSGHLQAAPTPSTTRMSRSFITTHVLDTARGTPAVGVPVTVSYKLRSSEDWKIAGKGVTNQDGRCSDLLDSSLLPSAGLEPGTYKVHFDTAAYYKLQSQPEPFYPYVEVAFNVRDSSQHYHIPLLLSPYAYSTYRGS